MSMKKHEYENSTPPLTQRKPSSWWTTLPTQIDVTDILFPNTTTTDELPGQLYALKLVDGIQLMWPLPKHIDSEKVYNAIYTSHNVDRLHYIE